MKKSDEGKPQRPGWHRWVALALLGGAPTLIVIAVTDGPDPVVAYTPDLVTPGVATPPGSDTAAPGARFGPGSAFELVLHPVTPEHGAVAANAFILRDGHAVAWHPNLEIKQDGTIRVAGTYESVFKGVAPGPIELMFAIGRPRKIPTDPAVLEAAAKGTLGPRKPDPWNLIEAHIVLVDAP